VRTINRPSVIIALLAFAALVLAGCQEEKTSIAGGFTPRERTEAGEPRAYQMGFSSLPAALTNEAYLAAFDFAANYSEVLLIQRPPSWANFLPDGLLSDELRERTITERTAIRERGLTLMLALDLFDPTERGRLAALPPGFVGENLHNPDLRQAFIAEARYLALNYRPAYLMLGVEVNATFEHNPSGYEAFADAYREAYRQVKEASPETRIFVSFQYEQLLGLIPSELPHVARWELIADFDGVLDFFAITSYPSFAFSVARKVPPLYYSQILDHTNLALALVSVGYASAPGREGLNSSTAAEQRRFLQRLFRDADELGAALVIWFAGLDPGYATQPPLDLLASIGLRTSDNEAKEAWPTWEETFARPYDREAATEPRPE
jgi:hypothetical protein